MPYDLADRVTLDRLPNRAGGGNRWSTAIYLSPGTLPVDRRQKVDPAQPDTETIAVNVAGWCKSTDISSSGAPADSPAPDIADTVYATLLE